MSELSFNCNDAPEPESFEPLPVNTVAPAEITESEYADANERGTRMLRLKFQVLDGPHKGRVISDGYCLVCPSSEKAVEIAQRSLRQRCEALNMTGFTQTEELHGKPLLVKFGVDKPNATGDVYNNIKSVKAYGASTQAPATPPVQKAEATPAEPAPTTTKAPWA